MLYDFGPTPDANQPVAGLLDLNGTLYGTTFTGGSGTGCGTGGCGTVFSVTTVGKERVLHSFAGGFHNDGANPQSSLIDVNGVLYGTTVAGGTPKGSYSSHGTVFSVTGSGRERILQNLSGAPDGAGPQVGLTYAGGNLYGTTCSGGVDGDGILYSITKTGEERIRHSFSAFEGNCPAGGVTALKRTLYGTTYYGGKYGGTYGWGVVYTLKI